MTKPAVKATTLVTVDGVPIDAVHLPGPKDLAIIVAHGFTLSWQRPRVWRIANWLNQKAGVITFDFRGHGRSGGLSTLGDREIKDLDVAVAWTLRDQALAEDPDQPGRLEADPCPPAEAAAKIAPVPLLIVHGDQDHYFPPEHARQLYMAAREPKELWLLPGMGHAESACDQDLVDRIAQWLDDAAQARPGSEWTTTQIACTGSPVLFRYSCGVEESNAIESPGPSS